MTNTFETTAANAGSFVSNLNANDELSFSARDVDAEKISQGHFARASTRISDNEAMNNMRVVIRDGSRQYVNGDYKPTDLVNIEGMEVPYETAVSLGLIQGNTFASQPEPKATQGQPQDTPQEATSKAIDAPLQGADLLKAQLELAVGDNASAVLDTFGEDIVSTGGISEAGYQYAQEKLGMNERSANALYEDMLETGSQTMASFMEHGDALGMERMSFLVDLAENGTNEEQAIVRNLWFQAATGKLTKASASDAFNYLYAPYE